MACLLPSASLAILLLIPHTRSSSPGPTATVRAVGADFLAAWQATGSHPYTGAWGKSNQIISASARPAARHRHTIIIASPHHRITASPHHQAAFESVSASWRMHRLVRHDCLHGAPDIRGLPRPRAPMVQVQRACAPPPRVGLGDPASHEETPPHPASSRHCFSSRIACAIGGS